MRRRVLSIAVLLCFATGAFGHQGVKNAAVKARMDAMSAIGKDMKVLGSMSKREVPFDATAAQLAVLSIVDHAAQTPALFEANEADPKSESKPEIWNNFSDFTKKSNALKDAAESLSGKIRLPEDLGPAMTSLGATCKSCHELYREKRE